VLGALLNQKWSEPRLASIVATTDGMLLGRAEGDIGFNEMIGDFADFSRNVRGMVESAGDVSIEESEFLEVLLKRLQAALKRQAEKPRRSSRSMRYQEPEIRSGFSTILSVCCVVRRGGLRDDDLFNISLLRSLGFFGSATAG
jgi:hypothetical protein